MASGDNNKTPGKNSVERIYQKKTQLEHILLRPDTYIGSVEPVTQSMWVYDEGVGMVNREITYVPGLYKIFDEILVNAADNKVRDKNMGTIKVDIDPENNKISVWNDGKGIPVVEHKVEKLHIPEMIFGHLLTSSNYNDTDKKVTGGRNGFGAKLCNIFSTQFTVETSSREYKKKYKQTWSGNMSKAHDKKIISCDKTDYTCITFRPDLSKFHMESLDKDIVALMTRRAYDIAGVTPGVKVYLNGMRLPVNNFKDYVGLYVNTMKDNGEPLKITHEKTGIRWEVCLTSSEKGFQQISFVNSIATTKGGRHVDYVMDQITKKLAEVVRKKNGKGGVDVKPYQIKNHCHVFVNCLIENPTFDSQTKENMTLQAKKFGSKCELTDKFLKSAAQSGIVDAILSWVKFKAQTQLNSKSAKKSSKLKGVPKLDDANDAGTKNSMHCTLILTEGDSAKTLAVSGLSVVGRDKYGVFPLRGKLLNVRDAAHKQIMENAEINAIIKIMGLKYGKKYTQEEDLKTLRYGRLMIMTDQDHDGSHIKGLLINFIHSNWPDLIQRRLLEEFITPIVKVTKGSETLAFYTLPEFEEWQHGAERAHTWKVKYYKGLGTSTSKEAKAYFAEMERHRIRFRYSGENDDSSIDMAFNKKRADDRKVWLTNFMEERKRCRAAQIAEPGSTLYSVDTKTLSYEDFVHKELVMFSCADLERSVPSFVDGLKPGQRKILYTCLKRNDKREIKVAQLAGSVAEISAYHHGEASLQGTIVTMSQNYVGSNNLNLLQPIGQFGTRLHGGKDAASPRYIFTMMSPLTKLLFPPVDENLLDWNYDDNVRVEPQWYCPIIPMVLVNGTEGIGTGWSTRVPNHDIREVVANCRRFIRGDDIVPMKASYKNFRGTLEEVEANKYVVSGEVSLLDDNSVEITELPIRTWTQNYKENVLEPLMNGSDKVQPQILEYREYNTDTTVRFVVKLSAQKLREAENKGLHKFFGLQNSLSCNNTLVTFDEFGGLRKYACTTDILKDFCVIRLRLYGDRKKFLVGQLTAESLKLSNQARFIIETIENKISISNKKKKVCLELLHTRGYDTDPVKTWKESIKKKTEQLTQQTNEDGEEEEVEEENPGRDYNYILNMPIMSLSYEKKEELLKQRDKKQSELEILLKKTTAGMWTEDLDIFMEELAKVEDKEREDELSSMTNGVGGGGGSSKRGKGKKPAAPKRGGGKQLQVKKETFPSEFGIKVEPVVDEQLRSRLTAVAKPRVKKEPKAKAAAAVKKEPVDLNDMDADKPPSLMDRIKGTSSTIKIKKESSSTSVSGSGGGSTEKKKMKQTKINFKKKPGKNPWDSSDDDDVTNDFSDADSPAPAAKRTTSSRATKNQKKYKMADSSSEEEVEQFSADSFDDSPAPVVVKKKAAPVAVKKEVEEEAPPPKKAPAAKQQPEKKAAMFESSSEDEKVVVKKPKPETKRKATTSKTKETKPPPPKKRSKMAESSDGDLSGIDDYSPPPAPRGRSARATAKSSKKYNFDDSDESDF